MKEMTRWRGELANTPPAPVEWAASGAFREPDPSAILQTLASNFRLIAAITLIGALIAYIVVKALPPQFTATTLIMLDPRNTLLEETESLFAGLPIADSYIESEIELIRSDAIVHRVIEREGLLDDPEFAGGSIPDGIRRMIESRAASPVAGKEGADELLAGVRLLQVADEARERLDVERRGLTQAIAIGFRSKSQVKARDLANAFAESYVEDQLNDKLSASERATSWLKAELTTLAKETQAAEAAVENYRKTHTLVGEGEEGVSTQHLRLLTEQIAAAKAEESEAQVKVDKLSALRASGQSPLLLPDIAEDESIRELRQELTAAEREEAEFASRYNSEIRENIPPYQEAHARAQAVQAALNREAARAAGEIEMRLASAQAVTQSLDEELKRLRADNAVVNAESVGLNELEREAEGKRQRYEALLTEYNTADNNAASQTPHARIVSQAALPLKPSAPRKPAVFGAAVIFSVALGMFIALLREVSRRTIRTPEELHAAANLRPIGVIPRIGGRRKEVAAAMRTIVGSANSIYAEAMRSLRAELSLSGGYDGGEVIAVTSPGAAAGKAALAAGLARSIALTGARTLLIDADLRYGEILPQLYQRYTGPDFASVLRDTVNWADARLSTKNPNLSILGAHPGGWDEAVSYAFTSRFGELVEAWRKDYNAIVINAPPTLAFPEARVIATCADDVLLCAEWNVSDRRLVAEAIDLLHEAGTTPRPVLTHVAPGPYKRIVGAAAAPPRRSRLRQLRSVS